MDGKEAVVGDWSVGRWVDILYEGDNRSGLKGRQVREVDWNANRRVDREYWGSQIGKYVELQNLPTKAD